MVLTDGKPAHIHAANGNSKLERDAGVRKVFKYSCEESGSDGSDYSPGVGSIKKNERSHISTKRKRK